MKTFRFVACVDQGIPVALCLEHDLIAQAATIEAMPAECAELIRVVATWDAEDGLDISSRPPPTDDVVADFRAVSGAVEFSVTVDLDEICGERRT